jgi:hypothetical protein
VASLRNLQQSLLWAMSYIRYRPLTIGGQEPALSCANLILQTILGPPFRWRWNRGTFTFTCVVTTPPTQDYPVVVSDFGFLEKAWVKLNDNSDLKELEVSSELSASVEKGRPKDIAAQSDDSAGTITFRLIVPPDVAYIAGGFYQKKAPVMSSVCSPWAPLPDECQYIYDWGLLALLAFYANDARAPMFNQKFMAHLLGAQEGLDELQRNIFLGNWLEITKQTERANMKTQQGIGARAQ